MDAANGTRSAEVFAGVVWMLLLGSTVVGLGVAAWLLTGSLNFFLRVLARTVLFTVGSLLIAVLHSGVEALWGDLWESDRAPIGSGWLAKSIAGLCMLLGADAAFDQNLPGPTTVEYVIRSLAFGSAALLASPSIERKWRRHVATTLTILVVARVPAYTLVLLADDAPGFWSALLVAVATAVFGAGLQLTIAFWLCRWTRRRLEARVARPPAPMIDPTA